MWLNRETRKGRIERTKRMIRGSTIAMGAALAFSVLAVFMSKFLPTFSWSAYICLVSFGAVLGMAVRLAEFNKKHHKWLEENENLVTVTDSLDPLRINLLEDGFFCMEIELLLFENSTPGKLDEALHLLSTTVKNHSRPFSWPFLGHFTGDKK